MKINTTIPTQSSFPRQVSRVPTVVFVDVIRRVRRHPYDVEPEREPAARRRVLRVARRSPPPVSLPFASRRVAPRRQFSSRNPLRIRSPRRSRTFSSATRAGFHGHQPESTTSPPRPRGSPTLATRTSRAARTRAARASSLSPPFRACRTTPACIARTGSPCRVPSFLPSRARVASSRVDRPRARRDLASSRARLRIPQSQSRTRHAPRARSVAGARDAAFAASRSPSDRARSPRKTRDAKKKIRRRKRSRAGSRARVAIDRASIATSTIDRSRSIARPTARPTARPRWMARWIDRWRSRATSATASAPTRASARRDERCRRAARRRCARVAGARAPSDAARGAGRAGRRDDGSATSPIEATPGRTTRARAARGGATARGMGIGSDARAGAARREAGRGRMGEGRRDARATRGDARVERRVAADDVRGERNDDDDDDDDDGARRDRRMMDRIRRRPRCGRCSRRERW